MNFDDSQLEELLVFAVEVAREAGVMIKDGQERRFKESASQHTKSSSVDLVTEVDKAVEEHVRSRINASYPHHLFIGEETFTGDETIPDEPTWIVDPIDGTANFVHGYPEVCTSIGLAVKGTPVVGVIYNPFLDHLYSAAKRKGAYFNQEKLPLYGKSKPLYGLADALVMVDCSSKRSTKSLKTKFDNYYRLAARQEDGGKMVHSIRIAGSAATSIGLTARGAVDLYAEIGAKPWDVCAGICILRESGGRVFGGRSSRLSNTALTDKELLSQKKFLFVRSIVASEIETSEEAQLRIAEEYYGVVEDFDP